MAFINLTEDDFLDIQDELDTAIKYKEEFYGKKGQLNKDKHNYLEGRVAGLQRVYSILGDAYSRDKGKSLYQVKIKRK